MELLQVENLTFTYPDGKKPALSDVSFAVREGTITVLCGASGCGKSTLLHLLKKELAPFVTKRGECYFDGTPSEKLENRVSASQIGILLQDPDSQIVTDVVWQELAFALENLGTDREWIRSRVAEMATYFGIEGWYHKRTSELSGGQKAKVLLLKLSMSGAKVLILDEPTRNFSPLSGPVIRKMLTEFPGAVISVSHDRKYLAEVCDKIYRLTPEGLREERP